MNLQPYYYLSQLEIYILREFFYGKISQKNKRRLFQNWTGVFSQIMHCKSEPATKYILETGKSIPCFSSLENYNPLYTHRTSFFKVTWWWHIKTRTVLCRLWLKSTVCWVCVRALLTTTTRVEPHVDETVANNIITRSELVAAAATQV